MSKVVCIGECLVDFLPCGDMMFAAKAGGAPANVCACVSKLGGKGCYLGKLSDDAFSQFLLKELRECGVNTDYTVIDSRYPTALAFVTLVDGERSFAFYRENTCDTMLSPDEISSEMLEQGDILHFCSVGLTQEPSLSAHVRAAELARECGATISYDFNLRPALWKSKEQMLTTAREFAIYADIIKASDDELDALYGVDEERAINEIFKENESVKVVLVTRGAKGAAVYDREGKKYSREAVATNVVDTTGAGDCFIGSVLYMLANGTTLDADGLGRAVDFASKAASIVVSRKGALRAMPAMEEVLNLNTDN